MDFCSHCFSKPPASPTAARELDLNDEHYDRTASPAQPRADHASQFEDAAPPKPPRPAKPNPVKQAENTLKEAFPSIDIAVIKAVLRASGGNVEPAFNALLGTVHQPNVGWDEALTKP
ncbi:MAG: hypothetical protein Q9221_000472 [Calogaya cf. arnoldii]